MKNKVVRILLSAVIAFGLWFYVVTVERTETEQTFYNVPVILDGESVLEDRGLMLTSDRNLTVTLKLNGNRSVLNKLRSSDITVLVDLTRIYEAGEKKLDYTISFPGDIGNRAIEVVNRNPSAITLTVAQWESKQIPLMAEVVGTPETGCEIDYEGITIKDDNGSLVSHIRVSGPKNILDQIAMAKVQADAAGADVSFVQRQMAVLCDASGKALEGDLSNVTVGQHEVQVTVPVLQQKTVSLQWSVTAGNGLTKEDVTLVLGYDTIILAGRPTAIEMVPDTIIVDTFDLSQITEDQTTGVFDIDYQMYDGVRISSAESEEKRTGKVSATLTLPAVEERTFDVELTADNIKNLPPNRTASFNGAQSMILTVTLKGRSTLLDRITDGDILVVIDVKDGFTKQYPAVVTVAEGLQEQLQVIGAYEVRITLTLGAQ